MKFNSYLILSLLVIFCCGQKPSNKKLELTLAVEKLILTSKNNEIIRNYTKNKVGYQSKLTIRNPSNKNFSFDMWTCSFQNFLKTNTFNAKILGPIRCDHNFISEITLKPNEKIEYNFIILKDEKKDLIYKPYLDNIKVGLIEIHTDWNLDKSEFDQANEKLKADSKKIFWSNSVGIN